MHINDILKLSDVKSGSFCFLLNWKTEVHKIMSEQFSKCCTLLHSCGERPIHKRTKPTVTSLLQTQLARVRSLVGSVFLVEVVSGVFPQP